MAIYAMSDIHGCYGSLMRKIKQLNNLESVKAGKINGYEGLNLKKGRRSTKDMPMKKKSKPADLESELLDKFWYDILSCNDLTDEKYLEILDVIGYECDEFDEADLSVSKIDSLVGRK